MTSSPLLLEITDYSFRFPGYPGLESGTLFQSMNFCLKRGEFRIMLGGPESGKTTLSRCLTAVYPGLTQAEVSGRISIDGESINSRSACDWIEQTGIVFQDPEEQIISTRCDDEAALPLESLGIPADRITALRSESFKHFSIEGMEERDPLSLSGGEKKRLLLASLEMQNPDLWILDETVDELDREGQTYLLEYLQKKAEQEGKGILLLASRYRDIYSRCGAGLALLKDGQILLQEDCPGFMELLEGEGLVSAPEEGRGVLPGTTDPLLQLNNIHFTYPGNPDFTLRIDALRVNRGETLFIAGSNGCGKSTLARILCGLLEPEEGEILLNGRTGEKDVLNRSCAYLFQNPDYQLFLPSVKEELALGLKYSSHSKDTRRKMVDDAVRLFKLPSGEAPPALLSFGARKRLQGAIYYLLEKHLYILDEADSGLSYEDYFCILRELKKKGAALIVISHDRSLRKAETGRTVFMEKGRIVSEEGRV
ncbi:MAG: ATP-binding cassette domain-containing protein [Spirochaetales bacterium]|nr:ATP-binding cassette domain-containing protein [Spirochaetales bacterium]